MWLSRGNAISLLEQLGTQEDFVCLQFTVNGPAGRKCSVLFRAWPYKVKGTMDKY